MYSSQQESDCYVASVEWRRCTVHSKKVTIMLHLWNGGGVQFNNMTIMLTSVK